MKAVDKVKIETRIPMFKDGVPATAIEVSRVKDSEGNSIQYNIVTGKGLHSDDAIYIQPDYTIPLNSLFVEYHAPGGDPKRSRLGKKGRVRAIKFNMHFEGSTEPIYSNGILVPWDEFKKWFDEESIKEGSYLQEIVLPWKEKIVVTDADNPAYDLIQVINFDAPDFPFQEVLGVEKYVADDNLDGSQPAGMVERDFPSFLYKTDEETIENHRKEVDRCYRDKEVLAFTRKRDGSSITEYIRLNPIEVVDEFGICSRKHEKKLDQTYVASYMDGEVELHPYFHPELKVRGWFNDATRTFYTREEAEAQFVPITAVQRDAWIDTDAKYGYLEKLRKYCQDYGLQLVIRGELVGAGNKGSGNKLNSDARTEAKVIWFGVDDLSTGFSRRNHYALEHNLTKVCSELGFEFTEELFSGVFTYDEIIAVANRYFKAEKEKTGIVVEGVVIRTKFSNNLSVKYINPEYDANS